MPAAKMNKNIVYFFGFQLNTRYTGRNEIFYRFHNRWYYFYRVCTVYIRKQRTILAGLIQFSHVTSYILLMPMFTFYGKSVTIKPTCHLLENLKEN